MRSLASEEFEIAAARYGATAKRLTACSTASYNRIPPLAIPESRFFGCGFPAVFLKSFRDLPLFILNFDTDFPFMVSVGPFTSRDEMVPVEGAPPPPM